MPTAPTDGHRMHYEVLGRGDPVPGTNGRVTFRHGNHGRLTRALSAGRRVTAA
jgi:hypothetical protein